MAQREQTIIEKARTTLNDTNPNNYRWTEERLYELLDEAQEDMCKNIPLLANKVTITISQGTTEYMLPEDCVKILSARSAKIGTLIISSYDEIEEFDFNWEETTSSIITHVVTNAVSQQTIRPYPLITTNLDLKIRYQALPVSLGWDKLTSTIVEELQINNMWDLALRQYIIGQAFLDYGDESSMSRSQVALGLYSKEFSTASRLAKKSFSKRAIVTKYQARVPANYTERGNYGCNR